MYDHIANSDLSLSLSGALVVPVSHAGQSEQGHRGHRCGHFHFLHLWCNGSRCMRPMKDVQNEKMSEECVLQLQLFVRLADYCLYVWRSYQSQKRCNDELILFMWGMKVIWR